jgi:alcohol-forming fatty acyl-CoA reductase
MGTSSCVNLSRAVLPGFAAGRGRGVLVPAASAASFTRRHGNVGGGVACSSGGGVASGPPFTFSDRGGASSTAAHYCADGIGVAEFLGGKNFLITGGTGFLAKGVIPASSSFSSQPATSDRQLSSSDRFYLLRLQFSSRRF